MTEQLTKLAAATIPCVWRGTQGDYCVDGFWHSGHRVAIGLCPNKCRDGRVYLFPDTVRESCWYCLGEGRFPSYGYYGVRGQGDVRPQCDRCQGRSWTSAVDGFTWMDAVKDLPGLSFKNFVEWWFVEMAGDWSAPCQPAFFTALERTVSGIVEVRL